MKHELAEAAELLKIDAAHEVERISKAIRQWLIDPLKRQGAVVAMSGGIDSSVVAALAVRALGRERVFGLLLPERDSSPETRRLSRNLVDHLGIDHVEEDITPVLESVGCYQRQQEAIRLVIPDFGPAWRSKLVLPGHVEGQPLRLFSIVAQSPQGERKEARLTPKAYLSLVAATNFKQRVRKMLEYYHADRLNYAVFGTPNRLEYDQGFFVKNGDGAADLKPIGHLYKTQVYQLAAYLGIPEEIQRRAPTTDTYSMEQTQEEFYFSLPYDKMDLFLYCRNAGWSAEEAAEALSSEHRIAELIYRDIDKKRDTSRYLHQAPLLLEDESGDSLLRPI